MVKPVNTDRDQPTLWEWRGMSDRISYPQVSRPCVPHISVIEEEVL